MAKMGKKKLLNRSCYDLALERINRAYDLYDHVNVSFSGGKDSTACLNLTLQVARESGRLPLRVYFWDEEAIPFETEQYVRRVAQHPDIQLEWYALPVKHRNACAPSSPWWSPWNPDEQALWVRLMPPEAIIELAGFPWTGDPRTQMSVPDATGLLHDPGRYGTCATIMGIRAEESLTRTRAVLHPRPENYIIHWTKASSKGNVWKVYPIYDWTVSDVWTAPGLFGWDYNAAYDIMTQAGIPPSQQRCSPAYGEEPLKGFHVYQTCFPDVWDKMSMRVPGANTALRYARTELYGFGDLPPKQDDESWEACLMRYVNRFSVEDAHIVRAQLRRAISEHFHKTSDPILPSVPHPISGVSWQALQSIAIRGDFKNRRAATMLNKVTEIPPEKAWAAYNAAREAEES
jgi:predicted phosphoadenosine phosphosulfate sulfurtransferase